MKYFLACISVLISSLAIGGTAVTKVNIDNPNPNVGEEVTFSLLPSGIAIGDITAATCAKCILPGDGTTCTIFDRSDEFKHTYTTPGNYTIMMNTTCFVGSNGKLGTPNSINGSGFLYTNNGTSPVGANLIMVSAAPVSTPSAIPTLSEWGLIILALGILLFGIVAVRQNSPISRRAI